MIVVHLISASGSQVKWVADADYVLRQVVPQIGGLLSTAEEEINAAFPATDVVDKKLRIGGAWPISQLDFFIPKGTALYVTGSGSAWFQLFLETPAEVG